MFYLTLLDKSNVKVISRSNDYFNVFCDLYVTRRIRLRVESILVSIMKQDCIPVGCAPPACWPYLPACTVQGGGPNGGAYLVLVGGGCSGGGYLPSPGGMSAPNGVPTWSGGVPAGSQGGGIPACTEADPP